MSTTTDNPAAQADEPLEGFSQCHVGITQRLAALDELPGLMEPAARARRLAADVLDFYERVVLEHHQDEERELFPAVLRSARVGEERDLVQAMIERLTTEHRMVESVFQRLAPALRDVARGRDAQLDAAEVTRLVDTYRAHAHFEEERFLPMAQAILGRDSNHMAALGLSLHLRHRPMFTAYV